MTQYRLLRNNKESGPYSKTQLAELGLKAYDLIWVEGKSAAWRYPGEIKDLEDFAPPVEEQPYDRFYKKEKEGTEKKQQPPIKVVEKKPKPRIRITADWRKLDTEKTAIPAIEKPSMPPSSGSTEEPGWKKIYADWKTRKNPEIKEQPEIVEMETKFSQPLSEIKEKYVETILKPRQEERINSSLRKAALYVILIPVILAAVWIGYKFKSKSQTIVQQVPAQNANENPAVTHENTAEILPQNNTNAVTENSDPAENKTTQKTQQDLDVSSEKIVKKDQVIEPVKQPSNHGNHILKNETKTPAATDSKKLISDVPAAKDEGTPKLKQEVPAINNPVKNTAKNKMDDYVVVNNPDKSYQNGVEDGRLVVKNKSDFKIDLAVVDVQYYDGNGKFQKGETVYVRNIPANNNVEVNIPDSKNSMSITYKVSLISAEQKTLYLIAD